MEIILYRDGAHHETAVTVEVDDKGRPPMILVIDGARYWDTEEVVDGKRQYSYEEGHQS